ncbi:MAG: ATP-binding protein, partial [Candidatus Eisenbacteria bacterium]
DRFSKGGEAAAMKLLEQVTRGKTPAPRRVLLYGTHGVGKSSWAAQAPRPVFLQTEDGLGEIDCNRFPLTTSFAGAMQVLSELYREPHPYQTMVVDSLDWMERLIWEAVCQKHGVESIEDIGFAKGYVFALTQWRDLLDGLSALRDHRSMTVILIAHSRIERFENPETESYDRYVPRLHKLAGPLVQEWCDEVLFATYKIYTKTTERGFNRKRTQGVGTGERIVYTQERPAHVAKNRLNLPDPIPLNWEAYAQHIPYEAGTAPQDETTKGE